MSFAIGLLAVIVTSLPSTRADSEVYDSSRQNKGFIISPDYPYSYLYSKNNGERIYRFYGEFYELVQIVFDNFDLPTPDPNEKCGNRNAILSYKREDRSLVALCGPDRPLPILSEKRSFTLEYRVPKEAVFSEKFRGFNASFKFVSNYGIESGIQIERTKCEFLYRSEDALNGTIYSPNFPGYYPRNMECRYEFRGTEKYLKINFTEFNLLGSSRCSVAGDMIELTETTDRDQNYFYERRCNQLESFNQTVNGSVFYVIFTSSNNYVADLTSSEPRQFVGFRAYYEFTNDSSSSPCAFSLPESSLHLLFPTLCLISSSWLSIRFT